MNRIRLPFALTLVLLAGLLWTGPVPVRGTGFVVDSHHDGSDRYDATPGDCTCADIYGECTLRAAIQEANACTGVDTITFQAAMSIYIDSAAGVLPSLDETVIIDASSVWDAVGDAPGVVINGGGGSFCGLYINAALCEIYGLYITGFEGDGITVASSANQIGGTGAGQRNVISGNRNGIFLYGSSAKINVLHNNYLGLTPAGDTKNPNETGLYISPGANGNIVGGNDPAQANFLSGNTSDGVRIEGADNNWLGGNAIGLSADGTVALGNGGYGVQIGGFSAGTIIGQDSSSGNIISNNTYSGIYVSGGATGTEIAHNLISGNEGDGVYISESNASVISDNLITGNTLNGVRVLGGSAAGNLIWPNSIWSNGGKGILLQNGGNMGIAAPAITGVTPGGASGTACADCRVALYSDLADEGQLYHDIVWADAAGNWTYTGPLTGPNVTATALDISGNTSEFSAPSSLGHTVFLPLIVHNAP